MPDDVEVFATEIRLGVGLVIATDIRLYKTWLGVLQEWNDGVDTPTSH
jgi:hypothetical protein